MISLIFSKVELYVTKNGIPFFCTASVLFNRVDLLYQIGFECFICTLFLQIDQPRGDNFGSQLVFYKVLFANGCYGFYI